MLILTCNLDQYLILTRETKQRQKKIDDEVMLANCDVKKKSLKLKISNTAFTLLLCVKVSFLQKNADFLQKSADISQINWALVLKGIFSEIKYVGVFWCQISSF